MTATDTAAEQISIEDFQAEAASWLKENAKPRSPKMAQRPNGARASSAFNLPQSRT